MNVDRHGTAHHDNGSSYALVKQFDAAIERLSSAHALQQSLPYSRLSVRYVLAFRTYNPDNDSEQEWGQEIVTSNQGNGELFGKASLPFAQLASRLCVFHCGPLEKGEPADIPTEDVDRAKGLARIAGRLGASRRCLAVKLDRTTRDRASFSAQGRRRATHVDCIRIPGHQGRFKLDRPDNGFGQRH